MTTQLFNLVFLSILYNIIWDKFFKKFFKIDLGEAFRFSLLGIANLRTFKKTINYNQITPLSTKDYTADLEHKKKKESN